MFRAIDDKRRDIVVLVMLLVVGIVYGVLANAYFVDRALVTFSVFTILPAVYLGASKRKDWKKILLSMAIFGVLFAIPFDFFEEFTGSWHATSLVIPLKILGVDPVDSILAHIEMTALTVIFYQHFIENAPGRKLSKYMAPAIALAVGAIIVLTFLYMYSPTSLQVAYPYAYMGTIASTLPLLLAWRKPGLIPDMVSTSIYFFVLYFCIEMIAVKNAFWIYPGRYIGWVTIFGTSFPVEELLFWMMLYAICIVSYYEVFIKG